MSQANIPDITPTISLSLAQSIPLLLDSIALEELALAHLINTEAEKTQWFIGTLTTAVTRSSLTVSVTDLLTVNKSVRRTLQAAIKKEMLLQFKFENVLDVLAATAGVTPFLV
ncbi:hypothetical protein [Alicyclobacillus mengziensis]|uniref:Uncharacterized protein n=1 Tax=Alicyclobacillus mengziensis TaxID=2931921 RepID=A0A9X7Z6V0_9BACL|nr:hypothetical protein [Alicyclobacillus mengziensis]QSO46640.1 hypothetical protein JZ786_19645 [Alicyclobacillus mengziensis]